MARMPGVTFLGISDNGVMSRHDIVCVHTIVGYQSGGNAAHFTTGASGRIVQARDTRYRSAANLNGNHRVIAIENEDHGSAYGRWNTNDGHAVPGFTAAQKEAIAKILVWANKAHGIPLVLAPDSRPGSRGIAYHRQGINSPNNFAGYAYKGRVSGGEVWSGATGKVCPGDRRITQLIREIIPRARQLAGLSGGSPLPKPKPEEDDFLSALSDKEQKDMHWTVSRLGLRFQSLTEEVNANEKKVDDIRRLLNGYKDLEWTVTRLPLRFETLTNEVNETEKKVDRVEKYAANLEKDNDDLRARLERIEGLLLALQPEEPPTEDAPTDETPVNGEVTE